MEDHRKVSIFWSLDATPPSSPLITLRSLIYHLSSFFHATSLASFTFHAFADDWLSLPLDAQEDAQNAFEEAGVPLIRLPGKSRERLEKILLVDLFTSLLDAYSKSSDKSTHSSSPLPLKHHSVVFVVPEPSSCVDAIAALRARGARVIMVVANEAQRRACIGHVEQTFLWEELLRQPVALVKKPRSFSARLETERKEHLEEPEVHNVTANGPSQHDKAAWEHLYGDEIEGSPIEETRIPYFDTPAQHRSRPPHPSHESSSPTLSPSSSISSPSDSRRSSALPDGDTASGWEVSNTPSTPYEGLLEVEGGTSTPRSAKSWRDREGGQGARIDDETSWLDGEQKKGKEKKEEDGSEPMGFDRWSVEEEQSLSREAEEEEAARWEPTSTRVAPGSDESQHLSGEEWGQKFIEFVLRPSLPLHLLTSPPSQPLLLVRHRSYSRPISAPPSTYTVLSTSTSTCTNSKPPPPPLSTGWAASVSRPGKDHVSSSSEGTFAPSGVFRPTPSTRSVPQSNGAIKKPSLSESSLFFPLVTVLRKLEDLFEQRGEEDYPLTWRQAGKELRLFDPDIYSHLKDKQGQPITSFGAYVVVAKKAGVVEVGDISTEEKQYRVKLTEKYRR